MFRREFLRLLLTTPVGACLRPFVFGAPVAEPDDDASTSYCQAFTWLKNLTDAENQLVRDYRSATLNDDVDQLIRRAEPAFVALRRGSQAARCDWGDVLTLDALNREQLDASNVKLARIAYLRSRRLIGRGQEREALDELFEVVRLGRRIGSSGLYIALLISQAYEDIAIAGLARGLPRLSRAARDGIAARLADAPAKVTWAEVMRREGRFIQATLRKKVESLAPPIRVDSLVDGVGFSREEANAVFALTGEDRERLLAMIDEVVPRLADLALVLALPRAEYQQALKNYVERVRPTNPIAASVVDGPEGLKYANDRLATLWTMLGAAVTRLNVDEKAFLSVHDPFGKGPFTFRPRRDGFELESALSFEQRPPVVLTVGEGMP